MSNRSELAALKNLLSQADRILETSPALPQNRTAACRELLTSAAILGRKGGSVTAKRGSDYFRKLAAKRKTHGGGRPRKESD
jgi:hypothetical protein